MDGVDGLADRRDISGPTLTGGTIYCALSRRRRGLGSRWDCLEIPGQRHVTPIKWESWMFRRCLGVGGEVIHWRHVLLSDIGGYKWPGLTRASAGEDSW